MTVGLQGLTAQPLARALGLVVEGPDESVDLNQTALESTPVASESGQ